MVFHLRTIKTVKVKRCLDQDGMTNSIKNMIKIVFLAFLARHSAFCYCENEQNY